MTRTYLTLLAALQIMWPGCATAQKAVTPPPYAGHYQPQGVDEIGLWKEMDEDERKLANSPIVIRDEALNAYVRSILCASVGTDRCNATRVYILRTPVFNASMTPNGTMRVFSGLLLRVRSEAELASVLGHEFGHFEQRHSVDRFKAQRSGSDLLSWAAVLGSMSNDAYAYQNFQNMQLSVYGQLLRFSRDQEREADQRGVGYLNSSALPPQAASTVWQNVMGEAEASAVSKGLSKPKFDRIAFFATHPPHAERARTLAALAAPDAAARADGATRYREALAPWLPLFLDDQIKLNDFGGSEYILQNLAENGWTPQLWLARGDLYRARGNPRDLINAAEFYQNAVAGNSDLAEAHRGLGLSLVKTGRRSDGQISLRRYLELKPQAHDAAMISMLVPANGEPK